MTTSVVAGFSAVAYLRTNVQDPGADPSIDAKPDELSSDRSRSGRARLRCVADGLQRMRGRATVRPKRKASSLKTAAFFASMIAATLFLSAALNALLGKRSAGGRCGCGFADTHAAAVSMASLVAANQFTARSRVIDSRRLTTNTVSKIAFTISSGGAPAARCRIIPGLVVVIGAAWVAAAFSLGHYN